MTVNPLLGADSLEPFVDRRSGRTARGLFVLVRTSNPGAADVQELRLPAAARSATGWPRWSPSSGAPGIGASGAARHRRGRRRHRARARWRALRELMPHAVFLLPGVGAQGGRVEDLAPAFAPGPAGGLVSASRGIVDGARAHGGDPAAAAARRGGQAARAGLALAADDAPALASDSQAVTSLAVGALV